jgi:hypothetical protein
MCKINMKTNFYFVTIYKHENNMARLWCKIMLKTGVEYVERNERNERSYFYLYHFKDLTQRSFRKAFYVCIK